MQCNVRGLQVLREEEKEEEREEAAAVWCVLQSKWSGMRRQVAKAGAGRAVSVKGQRGRTRSSSHLGAMPVPEGSWGAQGKLVGGSGRGFSPTHCWDMAPLPPHCLSPCLGPSVCLVGREVTDKVAPSLPC